MTFLLNAYERFVALIQSYQTHKGGWPLHNGWMVDDSIKFLASKCNVFKRWTANYRDRTNIRINLVGRDRSPGQQMLIDSQIFHLSSQMDNRTNVEIGKLTSKIAKETQRDSSSMITIAAVTMFFLPGTFVSVWPSPYPCRVTFANVRLQRQYLACRFSISA